MRLLTLRNILIVFVLVIIPLVFVVVYFFVFYKPYRLKVVSSSPGDKAGRSVVYDSPIKSSLSGKNGVWKNENTTRDYFVARFDGWKALENSNDKYMYLTDLTTGTTLVYRTIIDYPKKDEHDYNSDPQTSVTLEDLSALETGIGEHRVWLGTFDTLKAKVDKIFKTGDTLVIEEHPGVVKSEDRDGVEILRWVIIRRFGKDKVYE